MNRLIKWTAGICVGLAIAYQLVCYAETYTENGITIKESQVKPNKFISATLFDDHDPLTSTAHYNDASGTSATAGAINVSKYDDILVQMRVDTLGSTGADFDVEGSTEVSVSASTIWGHIYTKSFSAVTTKDFMFPVHEEGLKWVRTSVQATGTEGVDVISAFFRAKGKHK